MPLSRRRFLLAASASPLLVPDVLATFGPGKMPSATPGDSRAGARIDSTRFEPWITVYAPALRANVGVLSTLAGGRPILAVIKNNGYGLGLLEVARALEGDDRVAGFGVVKVAEALALREGGIAKPVLLLALWDDSEGEALVRQDVTLSLCIADAVQRATRAAARARRDAKAQAYIDTGMSRMGIPYHAALPVLRAAAQATGVTITGMLTELTEDRNFDREQVRRLTTLAADAQASGAAVRGPLHAASSHAVFNHPETRLDAVRPGISLFGAYPTDEGNERTIATLQVAFTLQARVVRVEQMRVGDTVSYGRRFRAESPTWIATIPVGHADGYPRRAVNGARILIGDRTYPVVGAVSASHCIVNLGSETAVKVGDVCSLVGPEHPDIHPNALAVAAGVSVYDVLMHLAQGLPRTVG